MASIDTVNDITPSVQYVATAAQTDFDYPFPIFEDSDLVVDVDGVTKSLSTHYTATGEGNDAGGTVTFVTPMTGDEVVTIYRDIGIERTTDFQQNGPYSSTSFNDDLDRITLVQQELEMKLGRAIRFSLIDEVDAADVELSPIANWTQKYIYINANGEPEPATAVSGSVLSRSNVGAVLYPQTAAEASAGVTPTYYYYPPGDVRRYGDNATPGTTDMTTAIRNAITVVSASGGGWVTGDFGTTYKVTDEIDLMEGVKWDLNNSTVNFVVSGDKRGFTPKSHTALQNGTITLTGSGLIGSAGDLHCPVIVGGYLTNLGYTDVRLKNLTLSTNRTNGSALGMNANNRNVEVDGITLPSSSTLGRGVVVHWSSDGSTPPGLTKHGYNIIIRNIHAGEMTYSTADAAVVFLSAVSNVLVENVYADRCQQAIVQIVAGDYGAEYAGSTIKALVHRNIHVRNVSCKQANTYGVYVEGWEDNYAGTPIISHPIVLENIRSVGDGTANVNSGIRTIKIKDVVVRNAEMSGHKHGIEFEEGSDQCRAYDSRCYSNREHGVYIEHATDPPNDCEVIGVECYANGQGGSTAAGIRVGQSNRSRVDRCILGADGTESTQDYGVHITSSAVDAIVERNHCRSTQTTAYALAGSTDYGTVALFRDNTCASGISDKLAGLNIIPISIDIGTDDVVHRRFRATRAVLTSDITPTAGTWVAGDIIYYENPVAGGYTGTLCVTSGSPGTWKRFGVIEA